MAGFKMDDYVDVAERIRQFYDKYPEGSLQSGDAPHVIEIGERSFIAYHAVAYRTPDDTRPAHGWAWEPVPGPTQFTKDSELMNAETAAWGRAIVALGFETKKIASANEVRNRQAAQNGHSAAEAATQEQLKVIETLCSEIAQARGVTVAQMKRALARDLGVSGLAGLTGDQAVLALDKLAAKKADLVTA